MRRVKKVTYYGYTELINANYAVDINALATGLVSYHLYTFFVNEETKEPFNHNVEFKKNESFRYQYTMFEKKQQQ